MPKRKSRKGATARASDICFVLMPFGGWLDDYYEEVYKPAIEDAGLEPHRADDLFRPSTIVNDIWAYTKRSKLLLADLSGKNPNVFYELGLAHALAKPAILVAESMDEIPFDLRALRILVYDKNAPNWGAVLREKIQSAIGEVLKVPVAAVLPAFLDVKGETPKPTISPHVKEIIELRQEVESLRRETRMRNSPPRALLEQLGPTEAERQITLWTRMGVPPEGIIDRLEGRGPPREWILERIQDAHRVLGDEAAKSRRSEPRAQAPKKDGRIGKQAIRATASEQSPRAGRIGPPRKRVASKGLGSGKARASAIQGKLPARVKTS